MSLKSKLKYHFAKFDGYYLFGGIIVAIILGIWIRNAVVETADSWPVATAVVLSSDIKEHSQANDFGNIHVRTSVKAKIEFTDGDQTVFTDLTVAYSASPHNYQDPKDLFRPGQRVLVKVDPND
ncbi:MAG: DUF3592 domain-containing protein, partial [Verrucomicrobiota bacterium]